MPKAPTFEEAVRVDSHAFTPTQCHPHSFNFKKLALPIMDLTLEAAKNQVLATAMLRTTFEFCG
jgi:hypothetical protein